jgi:hypothetical protein
MAETAVPAGHLVVGDMVYAPNICKFVQVSELKTESSRNYVTIKTPILSFMRKTTDIVIVVR